MGSPPSGIGLFARCVERERLLQAWTDCSNRVMRLQSEELAAIKNAGTVSAGFAEKIRLARAADVEACRAYHQHVHDHGCDWVPKKKPAEQKDSCR